VEKHSSGPGVLDSLEFKLVVDVVCEELADGKHHGDEAQKISERHDRRRVCAVCFVLPGRGVTKAYLLLVVEPVTVMRMQRHIHDPLHKTAFDACLVGVVGRAIGLDWKELWSAAASDGKLWIIDTAQRKVAASIDAKLNGANRLKFTPDGKRVLISILSTGDLFVYDVASRKEIKRVILDKGCAGILMDPDGSRAFVGCTAANYVAVVDLNTLTVTSHIDVGGGPDGLTWAKRP
jgi:YVTN family beta-propeller protein